MLLASEYLSPRDRDFVLSGYGVVAILRFLQGCRSSHNEHSPQRGEK